MSAAPHIFTLTGNLLAERTMEFASWSAGKTQRATRETFQVGGKGINVSKMLNRLGAANTALCFAGGASGQQCERWLNARNFAFRFFATRDETRTGTVVRAANQPETTFLGADVPPSQDAIVACAAFLDGQPDQQILALCGSFPGWSETTFDPLRAAIDRWLKRGIVVVDTYGPPLEWLTQRPVALVKINATEFRTLAPGSAPIADVLAQTPPRWPAGRWVISDGSAPVTFRDLGGSPATTMPPKVQEISPTGSGDVLLACLIQAIFLRQTSLKDALDGALRLAAANAAHAGVAEFPEPIELGE